MQTSFGEIRLEKHERSQMVGIDFWHLARLKRINTLLARLTYSISVGNIKQCVIHRVREKVRLRWLLRCRLGVHGDAAWITGVSASAIRTRQSASSLCFSSAATSSENGSVLWVCCQLKSCVMTMYEDGIRSHRGIMPEAARPEPGRVFPVPHLASTGRSSKPRPCIAVLLCT